MKKNEWKSRKRTRYDQRKTLNAETLAIDEEGNPFPMDTKGEHSGRSTPVRSSEDDFERKISGSVAVSKSSGRRSERIDNSEAFKEPNEEHREEANIKQPSLPS